ncbi:hypothetical protein ACICHK_00535 [Streptomyces sp. AHU1]|uniref:hypothetical protein n=1 Tax=Streptomyces sp. AHU1 TaxID=3377215 RepID=UPI003877FCFC
MELIMSDTSSLDAVLQDASRVRMTAPVAPERFLKGVIEVDLSDPAELDRLRSVMSVTSLPGYVCACGGDIRFEFFDADAQSLAVVVLHHGESLRWLGWNGHAVLADGHRLLRWLNDHGVPGPLRQMEADQREEERRQDARAHWRASMPTAVQDLADQLFAMSETGEDASPELWTELQDRMNLAFPDPADRALALMAWFGAGTGRASGYPLHESVPGLLLKDMPIAEIIAALEDPQADSRHYMGAVRHLTGWKSRRKQQRDVARLPEPVRLRLLQQAQTSSDQNMRDRAERWLAPKRTT